MERTQSPLRRPRHPSALAGEFDVIQRIPIFDDIDDPDVRHAAAAHWLALSLERMKPLPATHVACRWALSPAPEVRHTLASALEWTFRLVGDSIIVDHLARDPSPVIRVSAVRAAWSRRPTIGDDVLLRATDDPDAQVREIARLALRGR